MTAFVTESLKYVWFESELEQHWRAGHARPSARFWAAETVSEGEMPPSDHGYIYYTDNYEEHMEQDRRVPAFIDIRKVDALPLDYRDKLGPNDVVLVVTQHLRTAEEIFAPD